MSKLTSIQVKIQEALSQYETLQRVTAHINEIDAQLKVAYQRIKTFDAQLDKELKDIEDLEKIGVKSLFYKTLGSKEQQLEKERQDYLELSLKYKEFKQEVDLMKYERDLLVKKQMTVSELKSRIEILKNQRKEEILQSPDNPLRSEFLKLVQDHDLTIRLQKEIHEAIQEGEKAHKVLSTIVSYLAKAEDWGRWDMYGDNRRAKYVKKQSIDQALSLIPNAQHQLNVFMRELKDLGENNIVIKLDSIHFNKFRDFFFDNLISDWIIQQRIRNTLGNIEGTLSHVKRIVLSLRQEHEQVKDKLALLENNKNKIILA